MEQKNEAWFRYVIPKNKDSVMYEDDFIGKEEEEEEAEEEPKVKKHKQTGKNRHSFRKPKNGRLERVVDTKEPLKEEYKGNYTATSFDCEVVDIIGEEVECKFSEIYIDAACIVSYNVKGEQDMLSWADTEEKKETYNKFIDEREDLRK